MRGMRTPRVLGYWWDNNEEPILRTAALWVPLHELLPTVDVKIKCETNAPIMGNGIPSCVEGENTPGWWVWVGHNLWVPAPETWATEGDSTCVRKSGPIRDWGLLHTLEHPRGTRFRWALTR